jgi:hypothetical protein
MYWQEGYDGPADQAALIEERDLTTYVPPELLGDLDDELRPVDWNTIPADEAAGEWRDLNGWVDWIRKSHGLPATVIAPLWHRHEEMVWELSAQHLSFRASYHRDAQPTAPAAWRRDFWDAQQRLRQMVAACGTRIDRDRPTRVTAWPGELPIPTAAERVITNRAEDFEHFVAADVRQRREREARAAA